MKIDISEMKCEDQDIPVTYQNNAWKIMTTLIFPARRFFKFPIVITSGYRTPHHNAEVGGEDNSQHLTASAVDISAPGHNRALINFFKSRIGRLKIDQLISENTDHNGEPKWIHISISKNPRNMFLIR